MTFWDFNRLLTSKLLSWAAASTIIGLVLSVFGSFGRGLGSQFVGWAIVNAAIGFFGGRSSENKFVALGDQAYDPALQAEEARKLRRLLWINFGLDVLYMWGGWRLMTRKGAGSRTRGAGLGIILQGLFLFVFDGVHARQVPERFTDRDGIS